MQEVSVDDIRSFSIFDDGYVYNVKYLGFSFNYKNTRDIDSVHTYKVYLESHNRMYYFTVSYGIPWTEYELLNLQLQELDNPIKCTKTGNKKPTGCKQKYYINPYFDIVDAEFFSELFTYLMHQDYYRMEIHDRFEGLFGDSYSRNDFARFINEKLARE